MHPETIGSLAISNFPPPHVKTYRTISRHPPHPNSKNLCNTHHQTTHQPVKTLRNTLQHVAYSNTTFTTQNLNLRRNNLHQPTRKLLPEMINTPLAGALTINHTESATPKPQHKCKQTIINPETGTTHPTPAGLHVVPRKPQQFSLGRNSGDIISVATNLSTHYGFPQNIVTSNTPPTTTVSPKSHQQDHNRITTCRTNYKFMQKPRPKTNHNHSPSDTHPGGSQSCKVNRTACKSTNSS
eukprot:gene3322-2304_t